MGDASLLSRFPVLIPSICRLAHAYPVAVLPVLIRKLADRSRPQVLPPVAFRLSLFKTSHAISQHPHVEAANELRLRSLPHPRFADRVHLFEDFKWHAPQFSRALRRREFSSEHPLAPAAGFTFAHPCGQVPSLAHCAASDVSSRANALHSTELKTFCHNVTSNRLGYHRHGGPIQWFLDG